MDSGIYVALSREVGLFRDMDATANNIANVTTTGYQAGNLMFSDFLVSHTKQESSVAYANDVRTWRNTKQGSLEKTGGALDVAIQGKGYFVVQTPLGQRYTRAGNFQLDGAGTLITQEGYPVLDNAGQRIAFDETDKSVKIGDDGTINVDGDERSTINVVQFDNEQMMERVGNSLYKTDLSPHPAQDFKVANGMVERSNVDAVTQLSHMLYVSESVTDSAKFVEAMYALERKASDTLAKTSYS